MSKAPHKPAVEGSLWSRPPTAAAPVSDGDRALIEEFLAKKGARHFQEHETADRYHSLDWLQRRGIDIQFCTGNSAQPATLRWTLRGKIIRFAAFDALVNEERAKLGKPPLTV